jgi:hypothetical protein
MPRAGTEPEIPATKKLQTCVLDRVATRIGVTFIMWSYFSRTSNWHVNEIVLHLR